MSGIFGSILAKFSRDSQRTTSDDRKVPMRTRSDGDLPSGKYAFVSRISRSSSSASLATVRNKWGTRTRTRSQSDRDTLDNNKSSFFMKKPRRSSSVLPIAQRYQEEPRSISRSPHNYNDLNIETPAAYKGTYSMVYKGNRPGELVAVRATRAVRAVDSTRRELERERAVWSNLEHENVQRLLGVIKRQDLSPYDCTVSVWYQNGSLSEYMKTQKIPPTLCLRLIRDVAEGIRYLHSLNPSIIHGDLKPSNVLIDANKRAIVSDFGIAQSIRDELSKNMTTTVSKVNSIRYIASGLVIGTTSQNPTTYSDVWSLACVIYEISYSRPPYAHIEAKGNTSQLALFTEISNGRPPAKRPSNISKEETQLWKSVLEPSWNARPNKRPTAGSICQYLEQHEAALSLALPGHWIPIVTTSSSSSSNIPIVLSRNIDAIPDLSGKLVATDGPPVYQGPYSTVFRSKLDEREIAIKVLRLVGKDQEAIERKFAREAVTWHHLTHRHILPLLGLVKSDRYGTWPALVSPWCHHGDAAAYIQSVGIGTRVKLFYQTTLAVQHLHSFSPTLVHGDLKPCNVFIDENGNAKLSDFGLIRLVHDGPPTGLTTTAASMGTVRYLSYELIRNKNGGLPTTSSDVHALACIGMEFIYLQSPYAHISDNALYSIPLEIGQKVPPARRPARIRSKSERALWDLFEACWDRNPSARRDAAYICGWLETQQDELIDALDSK